MVRHVIADWVAVSAFRVGNRHWQRGDAVDLDALPVGAISVLLQVGSVRSARNPPPVVLPAAAPVEAVDPRHAGALAERARLQRIDDLTLPGYQALAVRAKRENLTPEAFAILYAIAEKQRLASVLQALRDDEAQLNVPAPGVTSGIDDGEATLAASMITLHRRMSGQP